MVCYCAFDMWRKAALTSLVGGLERLAVVARAAVHRNHEASMPMRAGAAGTDLNASGPNADRMSRPGRLTACNPVRCILRIHCMPN